MNECKIFCSECGFELQDGLGNLIGHEKERTPCPKCGSLARKIELSFHDSIEIHDDTTINLTRKLSGGKKILLKGKYGSEFHHDSQTWQERKRTVDIVNKKYDEIIINPTTGYKREVSEKLSDHKNRGSAKKKRK